jgi:hypothetical protein
LAGAKILADRRPLERPAPQFDELALALFRRDPPYCQRVPSWQSVVLVGGAARSAPPEQGADDAWPQFDPARPDLSRAKVALDAAVEIMGQIGRDMQGKD